MKTRVGHFKTGTGAAATTVAVTGFGFTPIAGRSFIQFWWTGRQEVANTIGNASHRRGVGISTGPSVNFSATTKSRDANVGADTACDAFDGQCVYLINASSDTVDGYGSISSYDADGFTFIINDQFGQDFTIFYKAYEGVDIQSTAYGLIAEPGSTGVVSYTFPGRRPDLLIAISTSGLVSAGISGDSRFSQGFASFAKGAIQQITFAAGSNDASNPTQTINYAQTGQFLSMLDTTLTLVTSRARVTDQNANGFDLTWDEVSGIGGRDWQILAVSGGQWFVGATVSVTVGNNITVTGVPFNPKGYSLISGNRAEPASDTPSTPDEWVFGAVDQNANQRSGSVEDNDNVATTIVTTVVQFDSVLASGDGTSPTPAIDSRITHTNFTADGWVMAQPTSDGSGRWIGYLTEGDANPPEADSIQSGQSFGMTRYGINSRRDI